ncbi:MAG: hypothetical protein ACP5QO_05560 [Clostridia bacterium]
MGIGTATPNGIYDLARHEGWVTVASDHDTVPLAVSASPAAHPPHPDDGRIADGHSGRARFG